MKVSVKEFKKEYKKINIDNIEVSRPCLPSVWRVFLLTHTVLEMLR